MPLGWFGPRGKCRCPCPSATVTCEDACVDDEASEEYAVELDGFSSQNCDGCTSANGQFILTPSETTDCRWEYYSDQICTMFGNPGYFSILLDFYGTYSVVLLVTFYVLTPAVAPSQQYRFAKSYSPDRIPCKSLNNVDIPFQAEDLGGSACSAPSPTATLSAS